MTAQKLLQELASQLDEEFVQLMNEKQYPAACAVQSLRHAIARTLIADMDEILTEIAEDAKRTGIKLSPASQNFTES